mgnify:CR=1 FL=1
MQGFELLVLIDGEFRSLIRNTLEKLIGSKLKKQPNKYREMLRKLSVRVVSSLIAIQLYGYLKDIKPTKEIVSFLLVGAFLYFVTLKENKQ